MKVLKQPNLTWIKWQSYFMLLLTVSLLLTVVVIWILLQSSSPQLSSIIDESQQPSSDDETNNEVSEQLLQINDDVPGFERQVKPIELNQTLIDANDHAEAFVDYLYLQDNRSKWTIQILDVSKEEIITDYLDTYALKSRNAKLVSSSLPSAVEDKFAYFRYIDKDSSTKRFLLQYGLYNSISQAQAELASIESRLNLPNNLTLQTVQISDYLDIIDDYEITKTVVNSSRLPREIRLRKIDPPRPPPPPQPSTTRKTKQTDVSSRTSRDTSDFKKLPVLPNDQLPTLSELQGTQLSTDRVVTPKNTPPKVSIKRPPTSEQSSNSISLANPPVQNVENTEPNNRNNVGDSKPLPSSASTDTAEQILLETPNNTTRPPSNVDSKSVTSPIPSKPEPADANAVFNPTDSPVQQPIEPTSQSKPTDDISELIEDLN